MECHLCQKDCPGGGGHLVLDEDVLGRDVLDEGVLGGGIMSTQGRLQADVPFEDNYVCFYFCPFVAALVSQTVKKKLFN